MKKMQGSYIMKITSSIVIFVLFFTVLSNVSFAQKNESSKPRINIDVNKEYDENGNIILYDSSYSYSWSDHGYNIDNDSIFEKLHHHFEIYNFDENHFSPHSYILPEFPNIDLKQFFRDADSSLMWDDDLDTLLRHNFNDDFLNWNFNYSPFDYKSVDSIINNLPFGFYKFPGKPDWHFQPFSPCDSMDYWYDPFKDRFPDIYFDDLEKQIEEMRKYFERNYGSSPFDQDNFYHRDLKDKHRNKQKKNTISIIT